MSVRRHVLSACALLLALPAPSSLAQTTTFDDRMVQTPNVERPGPASVAGDLATFFRGARSSSAGAFELTLPIDLPAQRATLLANVVPTYRHGRGLSEWGMGWGVDLSIYRSRRHGEIDYSNADEIVSPWGRLVAGDDGAYYPAGMSPPVRLVRTADTWTATDPAGTRYVFDHRQTTAEGTYRWTLTRVEGVHGETATLAWAQNDSGRAFLETVRWGYDRDEYELALSYEALPLAFTDYRSGAGVELDRRVGAIAVRVRNAATGAFELRHRHDLGYELDPYGQASYLHRVIKVFPGGETMPAITYDYALLDETLDAATFALNEPLQRYVSLAGPAALSPDTATVTDVDRDGRADLEHYYGRVLIRQADDEWAIEGLPPSPADSPAPCGRARSHTNQPRTLARLRGSDDEPLVFNAIQTSTGSTEVFVCTRAGALVERRTYPGNWTLGARTRLVDLDNDLRPDLIRVDNSGYTVLRNVSDEDQIRFEAMPRGSLALSFVTAVWVHDMNGDGIPDLVGLHDNGFAVWHGRGRMQYGPARVVMPLVTASGFPLTNAPAYRATFLDLNRDGLRDLLLSRQGGFFLFMNRGNRLAERRLPAGLLTTLAGEWGLPLVADMDGSGDTQLTIVKNRSPYTARLSTPNVGLLVNADDGRGSRVAIDYARPPARADFEARSPVVAQTIVRRTGRGDVYSQFDYDRPALHSRTRLLLGFDQVTEHARNGTVAATFRHDDELPAELVEVISSGGISVQRFERTDYAEASYRGVRMRRKLRTETGWIDGTGAIGSTRTTEYVRYERGVCATETRETTADSTLTDVQVLADPFALTGALHCLPLKSRAAGTHPADAASDFAHTLAYIRNAAGDPTALILIGGGRELLLQDIEYDSAGRVVATTRPGRGSEIAGYDAAGRLSSVTAPTGVREEVVRADGVTDGLVEVRLDRGGAGVTSWFQYDGRERLAAEWDDVSGGHATDPLTGYAYRYATHDALASVRTTKRFDGGVADALTVAAADGEPVATGRLVDVGWALGDIEERDEDQGMETRWRTSPISASTTTPTMDELIGSAELIASAVTTSVGLRRALDDTFATGVTGYRVSTYAIAGGRLVRTDNINDGIYYTTTVFDAASRPVSVVDEIGSETNIHRDALGRVRQVVLPTGATHRRDYDGLGRVARIERTGVGAVDYTYGPRGLLAEEVWTDPAGAVVRQVHYERDAIGRTLTASYELGDGSDAERIDYGYDGRSVDGEPLFDGQLGQVTEVETGPYRRTRQFDQVGRLVEEVVTLGDWRTVQTRLHYERDSVIGGTTTTVRDAATGALVYEAAQRTERDAFGRPVTLRVNGEAAVTVTYDHEGKLATATLADGSALSFGYDATTRALKEKVIDHGDGWLALTDWRWDRRGAIASDFLYAAGESELRGYRRDPSLRLTSVERSSGAMDRYDYDADGLLRNHDDDAGTRSFDRRPNATTTVADVDAMGRLSRLGDVRITYGPRGDVDTAERAGVTWRYVHDADGMRVGRVRDGQFEIGFVGGAAITEAHVVTPVAIGDMLVGVMIDGQVRSLATDARGTVFGSAHGLAVASAYGVREAPLFDPVLAEAIDYAQTGRDAVLGTVRLGVRDYAPSLGQFLTFDPLYFAEPERCADKPRECNLFGYASGDPLTFVDPAGTDPLKWQPSDPHDGLWSTSTALHTFDGGRTRIGAITLGAGSVGLNAAGLNLNLFKGEVALLEHDFNIVGTGTGPITQTMHALRPEFGVNLTEGLLPSFTARVVLAAHETKYQACFVLCGGLSIEAGIAIDMQRAFLLPFYFDVAFGVTASPNAASEWKQVTDWVSDQLAPIERGLYESIGTIEGWERLVGVSGSSSY